MKLTIEVLQQIASDKGGSCLSDSYKGRRVKLDWVCANGHRWSATPETIKLGYWCATCSGVVRTTIQDLHKAAEERGGKCLSTEYKNPKVQNKWQCSNGHTWLASWSSIKYAKTWCPECGKWKSGLNRRKYSIDTLRLYAENKGGKCLSDKYLGHSCHHEWECASGHRWQAKWNNVITGKTWCPECSRGTGERICRTIFEQLFRSEFPSVKPKWLRSDRGFLMELDGYSKEWGIAFEHQGTQHSINRKHFKDAFFSTSEPSNFQALQKRDILKAKLCRQKGILLIQVPSILEVLGVENIKSFIRQELLKNHYPLPEGFDEIEVKPDAAYNFSKLADLQELANMREGKLLSEEYFSSKSKYKWECSNGHRWWAKADNVKQGKWCKTCAGLDKKTIEEMQEFAATRQGLCLSRNYNGNQSYLLWQCKEGHQWKAIPNNVLRGSWCPICRDKVNGEKKRKYQINDLISLAQTKGGTLLSREYTITHAKYLWKCTKGHKWEMTFDKVMQGYWCPGCAGNARKTLTDLQNAAQERGGKCLSSEYKNIKTKYTWQCKHQHVWETTADCVLRGTWCRKCSSSAARV